MTNETKEILERIKEKLDQRITIYENSYYDCESGSRCSRLEGMWDAMIKASDIIDDEIVKIENNE